MQQQRLLAVERLFANQRTEDAQIVGTRRQLRQQLTDA
jgi:hypothetical protein